MGKDSALYQLMDVRMHSVMNGIVSSDGEYQAILRRSDIYSGELDRMDLSKEIQDLHKRIAELEKERLFLKKAAAFFAREAD